MSAEWDEYSIASTFKYKIPFLILGILVGMVTVLAALKWVPGVLFKVVEAGLQSGG
jgi:hypothetical protein